MKSINFRILKDKSKEALSTMKLMDTKELKRNFIIQGDGRTQII